MAPVSATALGITPQIIDDVELSNLLTSLNELNFGSKDIDRADVSQLVSIVEKYPEWKFEEQVDLYEWIPTLNSIDTVLAHFLETYPNLLLVAPVERKKAFTSEGTSISSAHKCAASRDDSPPPSVVPSLCSILAFLASLLRHSINKSVFQSVEELVDLLGAADDTIASLALRALSHLATPPALHKQQAPEGHQHTSALHSSKSQSHKRLVALARGWGSRGSGLGLFACVTADDSEHFDLPQEAGEVSFDFFAPVDNMQLDGEPVKHLEKGKLLSIHLCTNDIVTVPVNSASTTETKQKRQRLEDMRPKGMMTRPTDELFFKCLDEAGGRERIPDDRLFALLADIRLAKSFHSSGSRVQAIESRLLALIAILYAHPSQDIMSGYFQAQPELCVELIDLVRPTVSSGTVSATSTKASIPGETSSLRPISALANPQEVPYSVRNLAIESLTALVARRDGASGGLTGVARQSNILNELGVGKGIYLGLLPTLVRFSLASLTNFLTSKNEAGVTKETSDDVSLDIGLAFIAASRPPSLSERDQVVNALAFVDVVLSLTSAVASAPSGTAALTDCGIIPALLSTVTLDSKTIAKALSTLSEDLSESDCSRIHAQVRFIASQAIQIIEGTIVTHNNALSAFHDFKGVDILIDRLKEEMLIAKVESTLGVVPMQTDDSTDHPDRKLVASRRVLLFSIVNCLTVVFHQESSSTTTSSGGAQLRNTELTFVITEVMQCVQSYGGVLAALTCSLLSDVMNSDPHVVYHVHKSGVATAFFNMIAAENINDGVREPALPPVPELIMALPNVIAALSLTTDGSSQVKERNPFPSLLKVLFHPKYVMPRSRCLLNEMTSIVGTGLDEVMRHVPNLRSLVMQSIVHSMCEVINIGKSLVEREELSRPQNENDSLATALENERTCLIQYTLNLGQMLEQILHTEDHCDPFVQAGGLEAILELFPLLVPPTTQFLANVTSLSSPSVSTLAHTTTEDSLSISFRCIAINYDSQKMLKVMAENLEKGMDKVEETQGQVREAFPATTLTFFDSQVPGAFGALDGLPRQTLYELRDQPGWNEKGKFLANYLRAVTTLQWQTNLLSTVIRAACQRSQEVNNGWGRVEREWKKELSSPTFENLLDRIAVFHQTAILESCRIRSEEDFEPAFRNRHLKAEEGEFIRYRLRIVCQEGAVVRDGIEIDSCSNIGSMEMGEVTDAYERCINSSGVMRYRTRRGWVSELTRGHGREPIAEVLDISRVDPTEVPKPLNSQTPKKRFEYRVASFRSVGASILARMQTSFRELFTSLSRVASNGIRALPVRSVSFLSGTVGCHTRTLLKVLFSGLSAAMNQPPVVCIVKGKRPESTSLNEAGAAMFLGTILGIVSSSLYEDKRERRTVNVALLLSIVNTDNFFWTNASPRLGAHADSPPKLPEIGLFDAIRFTFEYDLQSVSLGRNEVSTSEDISKPVQSLNRVAAASLPPVIAILRRLMGGVIIKQSPVTSILDRLSLVDLGTLIGDSKEQPVHNLFCRVDGGEKKFSPERFVRAMHFCVAEIVLAVWKDIRFRGMPPHVVHPMTTLSIEILGGLEDAAKPSPASGGPGQQVFRRRPGVDEAIDQQRQGEANQNAEPIQHAEGEQDAEGPAEPQFQPSDEAINRLMEMGFGRDHALNAIESTESNRLEVAMEYALAHPPPSPGAMERRREQRQESSIGEAVEDSNENSSPVIESQMGEAGDSESVKSEGEASGKELSQPPSSQKEDEAIEAKVVEVLNACLDEWIDASPAVAIGLVAEADVAAPEVGAGKGDGDKEALTVVVCSFLINLCQKYTEKSETIVRALLAKLKSNFIEIRDADRLTNVLKKGSESQVASLCHAAVLFGRAIPKTRMLVLEQGLVGSVMSALDEFCSTLNDVDDESTVQWPAWLASSILLMDVMVQPLVAFSETPSEGEEKKRNEHEEFVLVRSEHRRKAKCFSEVADQLFLALRRGACDNGDVNQSSFSSTGKKSDDTMDDLAPTTDMSVADSMDAKSPFSGVPPFFPMIPDETAKAAMRFCLNALSTDKKKKNREPPPGITHALLLLLSNLLRSSTLATECLREGAPNLILALPRECRFNGNAGIVTAVLRRLLEDETNLKIAMETEIRSIFAKLHRKQSHQGPPENQHSAPAKAFLQAVTPLLCRDPMTFLKVVLSTVSFASKQSSNGHKLVTLLSPELSQRNMRAIGSFKCKTQANEKDAEDKLDEGKKTKSSSTKSAKKSPHRGSLARRGSLSKKTKKDKPDKLLNGSPSNHVMSLLIEKLIFLSSDGESSGLSGRNFGEDISFLWVADILEIMADLVLAIPACAAAIHRFRFSSGKGNHVIGNEPMHLSHALSGCPSPPQTVVSFLLHRLLPQDRWSYRQDQDTWDRRGQQDETRKQRNKDSYMKTKVAQTTARLLVALVARAGEGRRRVVADLSLALSGGRQQSYGLNSAATAEALTPDYAASREIELFALQAWGDLCIGLAAPRSNGVNHDSNSNLSFDVVKLMLDFKMAHSLIYAVKRVNLKHPMAATACGSLLVPLEVFTRSSVTDAVQALADKEDSEREKTNKASNVQLASTPEKKSKLGESRNISLGPSQRRESSFADDTMLAEGFDAEAAVRNRADSEDEEDEEVAMEVLQDGDVVIDDDADMEDGSDDEDDDEEGSDEDGENDDDSDDSDSDSDDEDNSSVDDEESENEDDDDHDDNDVVEELVEPGAGTWDEEMGDFFDGEEEEDGEDGEQDRSNDLDDWDQIEAPPFGGSVLGGRRRRGNLSSRARGFVDAAEAMIGSLLRTGEIQGDALAEIEGTLGIRIAGNANPNGWIDRGSRIWGSHSDGRPGQRQTNNRTRNNNEVIGTVPHVNQRRPPDVGYSGQGGRWNDISSMEFVFGGPTLTSGSRNFDVVSAQSRDNETTYTLPSAVDSQLFPGGPASSTHARTQQAFHPLLCGIDLPPVNSLVSDLLPHGDRATRMGEMSTRRNDDWTSWSVSSNAGGYMVSTSNGHLMRISRGQGQIGGSTPRAGHDHWEGEGQASDSFVGAFSNALESAVNDTTPRQNGLIEGDPLVQDEPDPLVTQAEDDANGVANEGAGDDESATDEPMTGVEAEDQPQESTESPTDQERLEDRMFTSNSSENGASANEGEGVASSLVEGLHLSDVGGQGSHDAHADIDNAADDEDIDDAVDDDDIDAAADADGADDDSDDAEGDDIREANAADEEEILDEDVDVPTGVAQAGDVVGPSVQDNEPNSNGFVCPPGMDLEVFNSLPMEMQREVVDQHQATMELAAQLGSTSGLDPEALAALPEDMRREVIAQEQRERRLRESAPADPSNAEDMDNASFVASLAPDLRREILFTADEAFLNSLPPDIIAEAQLLRERASHQHRRLQDPAGQGDDGGAAVGDHGEAAEDIGASTTPSRKKQRHGKLKVDCDRYPVLYLPGVPTFPTEPFGSEELQSLIQLLFLLSPVRPQRLLQKVFQNICSNANLRAVITSAFTRLLNDDGNGTAAAVEMLTSNNSANEGRNEEDESDNVFPPRSLIGAAPDVLDLNPNSHFFRVRQGSSCAASIASSLPTTVKVSSNMRHMPPVVSTRVIDTLSFLGKNSSKVCLEVLTNSMNGVGVSNDLTGTSFEQMLDLLQNPRYIKSSTNLEHLLSMIEIMIFPLASLFRLEEDDSEVSQKDVEAAAAAGKEWVDIPRVVVSQSRLKLLCSILKMESCREAAFSKVNGITKRLCKVEANRSHVLGELASVAQALGEDAKRDLRSLLLRMNDAVSVQKKQKTEAESDGKYGIAEQSMLPGGTPSSSVTLSSSSSELKLLRVLQTLQSLCSDNPGEDPIRRKNDAKIFVTAELIEILQGIRLNQLWDQLSSCLRVVKVLEGIATVDEIDEKNGENDEEMVEEDVNGETGDEGSESILNSGKKVQNSSAGLLTRFLPAIEAFFVVNASATRDDKSDDSKPPPQGDGKPVEAGLAVQQKEDKMESDGSILVGGKHVIDFVAENKVILNALLRNNPGLLEKGLRAMVQIPRCRVYLDFDVKRQWFKTQIRRMRQQASRRHGSLRLGIRRKYVFEDAYHQLRLRNAEEMRSRLHITFRNEEGVDAGGLSREFFGILAKEMFNANYALFTSTEDGCTFQPNPNSSINPDHLSYLRFVGRIVGKAVADGFLLDAHFTRSLYKHMLGLEPTHHDMEAIDPDYYKNLKMILEYNLADIGLELTFSIEDHSFGRSKIIDLIPDGRNVPVTDETKTKYVSLVCKHRMTTSIKSQIKAYLDGFYELVSRDLIAIFTPRELELLISGLPDIDVHDLKKNTDYQGWKATDPEIEWFWTIMFSLSRNEKAAFLQFVTGSSKVPLAGFSELQGMRGVQKFSIHKASGSNGALMSAHTCFNSLDLPKYKSQEEMKEKLLYAISEGQGSFQFA